MKLTKIILWMCLFCFLTINPVSAAVGIEEGSLFGIKSLGIAIDNDDEARDVGITDAMLRKTTELKLRLAGISIPEDLSGIDGVISVDLYAIEVKNTGNDKYTLGYAFCLSVYLSQPAFLERNREIFVIGNTWSRTAPYITGKSSNEAQSMTKDVLEGLMDSFLNAYLTANPRK